MDANTVRVQGQAEVIHEIAELVEGGGSTRILRIDEDDMGGTGADFALETVATIIAVVTGVAGLLVDKPLVPLLLEIFRRHPGTRVVVETPTQTVTIESNGTLSAEKLEAVLEALARD